MMNQSVWKRLLSLLMALSLCMSLVITAVPMAMAEDEDDSAVEMQSFDEAEEEDDEEDEKKEEKQNEDDEEEEEQEEDKKEEDKKEEDKKEDDKKEEDKKEDEDEEEEKHKHDFSFELNEAENKITAYCDEDDCPLSRSKISMSISSANKSYDGKAYEAVLEDAKEFSEETGATVGKITYSRAGSGTVSSAIASGYYTATVAVTVNGVPKTLRTEFNIARREVTLIDLNVADKPYDGTTKAEPDLKKLKIDGILTGDDVSLDFGGAEFPKADVGVYSVTIKDPKLKGKDADNYTLKSEGDIKCDFVEITRRDISDAKVTLGPTLFANGKEQKQTVESVEIEIADTKETLPVTYSVSKDTGTSEGVYTMTITGTENFSGTIQQKFSILPDISTIQGNQAVIGDGTAVFIVEDNGQSLIVDSTLKEILAGISAETLERIASGSQIVWTLRVAPAALDAQRTQAVQKAAGAYTLDGSVIHMTLTEMENGVTKTIQRAPFVLSMSLAKPEKLKKVTEFRVICTSEEQMYSAEAMGAKLNAEGTLVRFSTDRFGDVVLAYNGKTGGSIGTAVLVTALVLVLLAAGGAIVFLIIKVRNAGDTDDRDVDLQEAESLSDIPGYDAMNDFVDGLKEWFEDFMAKFKKAPKETIAEHHVKKAAPVQEWPVPGGKKSEQTPETEMIQDELEDTDAEAVPEDKTEETKHAPTLADALEDDSMDLDKLMELLGEDNSSN